LSCLQTVGFRLKPEQLATLWNTNIKPDDSDHVTPLSESLSQFILSDEQFSSLLGTASTSVLPTHSKSTTIMKSNLERTSQSVSSLPHQSIKSNESISVAQASSDTQNQQVSSTLTDQLTAMQKRLKSSVQTHTEVVKMISNSMLKRNQMESSLNLVHQLSLHSIDDISTKEVETIPSFVLDLLKMNTITENIYKSIKQGGLTSDVLDKPNDRDTKSKEIIDLITSRNLNKTIIANIESHQLTYPQIHKIQTQLLTPKLIGKNVILSLINYICKSLSDEFKSGHLSQRILDAYKSQSPMQIINKVRSSITQLNTLLLQQSSIISSSKTTLTTDDVFDADTAIVENQIAPAEHGEYNKKSIYVRISFVYYVVHTLSRATQQGPIVIYPESALIRQQILQELRDRLDTQLIELKKEYHIEPVKGELFISFVRL
jgi:hypothetical protein